jgi:hypothetical protein
VDRKEAQTILSALRPDGPEAQEPLFTEALKLAASDPELKAWWQAQQEFDRKVAAKLAEVPLPADLRESILRRRKISPFRPRVSYSTLLAAAAVVAILCVAGTFWRVANYGPVDQSDYAESAVSELGDKGPDLAMLSTDHDKVKAWLKQQDAPLGHMPPKFASIPSIGCQRYVIHGHTVSLICFTLDGGGEAHLFMVDKNALNDPPGENGLQFGNVKGWNVAAWSDDRMTYMVATQESLDTLKGLL